MTIIAHSETLLQVDMLGLQISTTMMKRVCLKHQECIVLRKMEKLSVQDKATISSTGHAPIHNKLTWGFFNLQNVTYRI